MKKNILITGSAGFVGTHTVEWLLKHTDWNIIGLDSFRHMGDAERINSQSLSRHTRYKIICHDLNAPISERTKKRIGEIHYIINCASISHVDTSISDPIYVWESNTRLIGNILEYARNMPSLEKMIHCSTDEVFGPADKEHDHTEWSDIKPSNPYAASKAAQDALCYSYWRTYGVPVMVTHTMNMIGTMQDPEKYLPKIISRIIKGETITVHGNEKEIGSRMYLDVRNLADAWLWILKSIDLPVYGKSGSEFLKYNIAGLKEINNLELVEMVAQKMGKEFKFEFEDFHKTRPGHDLRYALDPIKILKDGWSAPIRLDQTLEEVISHVRHNSEWQEN